MDFSRASSHSETTAAPNRRFQADSNNRIATNFFEHMRGLNYLLHQFKSQIHTAEHSQQETIRRFIDTFFRCV